ncbi:hypothetical protein D3C81_1449170 [compost metagenome]
MVPNSFFNVLSKRSLISPSSMALSFDVRFLIDRRITLITIIEMALSINKQITKITVAAVSPSL